MTVKSTSRKSKKEKPPPKRKPHPKFTHIYVDVFAINIWWIRCKWSEYVYCVKHEFDTEPPSADKHSKGRFEIYEKSEQEENIPIGVIYLSEESKAGVLAHECFHAAHWICEDKGISLTDSSQEIYAYLIQYLMQKISNN